MSFNIEVPSKQPTATDRQIGFVKRVLGEFCFRKKYHPDLLKTAPKKTLAEIVKLFIEELRRRDGTPYKPTSLLTIRRCLALILVSSFGRNDVTDLASDADFACANDVFRDLLVESQVRILGDVAESSRLTMEKVVALYRSGQLATSSCRDPHILLQTVYFLFCYHTTITSSQQLRKIKIYHVREWRQGGRITGIVFDFRDIPEISLQKKLHYINEAPGKPWCPVALISSYMAHRNHDTDIFFQKPVSAILGTCWYSKCPLSNYSPLSQMCQAANIKPGLQTCCFKVSNRDYRIKSSLNAVYGILYPPANHPQGQAGRGSPNRGVQTRRGEDISVPSHNPQQEATSCEFAQGAFKKSQYGHPANGTHLPLDVQLTASLWVPPSAACRSEKSLNDGTLDIASARQVTERQCKGHSTNRGLGACPEPFPKRKRTPGETLDGPPAKEARLFPSGLEDKPNSVKTSSLRQSAARHTPASSRPNENDLAVLTSDALSVNEDPLDLQVDSLRSRQPSQKAASCLPPDSNSAERITREHIAPTFTAESQSTANDKDVIRDDIEQVSTTVESLLGMPSVIESRSGIIDLLFRVTDLIKMHMVNGESERRCAGLQREVNNSTENCRTVPSNKNDLKSSEERKLQNKSFARSEDDGFQNVSSDRDQVLNAVSSKRFSFANANPIGHHQEKNAQANELGNKMVTGSGNCAKDLILVKEVDESYSGMRVCSDHTKRDALSSNECLLNQAQPCQSKISAVQATTDACQAKGSTQEVMQRQMPAQLQLSLAHQSARNQVLQQQSDISAANHSIKAIAAAKLDSREAESIQVSSPAYDFLSSQPRIVKRTFQSNSGDKASQKPLPRHDFHELLEQQLTFDHRYDYRRSHTVPDLSQAELLTVCNNPKCLLPICKAHLASLYMQKFHRAKIYVGSSHEGPSKTRLIQSTSDAATQTEASNSGHSDSVSRQTEASHMKSLIDGTRTAPEVTIKTEHESDVEEEPDIDILHHFAFDT